MCWIKNLIFAIIKKLLFCSDRLILNPFIIQLFSSTRAYMNFRELLIVLPLAILTSLGIQYYFGPRKEAAVVQQAEQKPLKLEVDFLDKKTAKKPVITEFETEHTRYKFSSAGASLENIEFKRNWGGKEGYLTTIFPPEPGQKDKSTFLVAFDEKTPYYFDVVQQQEYDDHFELTYAADFIDGTLQKKFIIYKNLFKVDLVVTVEPNAGFKGTLQPRIFYTSPIVPELGTKDILKGIVAVGSEKIQILDKTEENITKSWEKPTLFGAQDRYFVHALVHDTHNFVQRAYYKIFDLENLFSVLEGPVIQAKTSWDLSFYFGPKEDEALVAVDERLEQTLNYGWFGKVSRPVSKILLHILKVIYGYCNNYGVAIIILTFLMKLILLPFTYRSEQGMKKNLEYQKKMEYLQNKYKHDKEALRVAQAELLRKNGIPGLSGCLPLLLLQTPLFIALSWVISNSIELFMAPFLWIHDLSAPDPYYILPLLVMVAMIFHSPTNDPKKRLSSFAVAVVFAAFTTTFSAGLALYLLTSSALGVLQAQVTKRFFA